MLDKYQKGEKCELSIIVPVYNAEPYLHRCIKSILRQTFTDFELILIDDGSVDGSGKICDYYLQQDKRIMVYHTKNRGSVASRKVGVNHSRGRYICFVDSDDYVETDMFHVLLQKIDQSGADFVHTGYVEEMNGKKREIYGFEESFFFLQDRKERERFLIDYLLHTAQGRGITYSIWSKIFKRDLIERCFDLLPDEQQFGEDFLCLCLCILESGRIMLSRSALYHYVRQEKSLAHMDNTELLIKDMNLNYHFTKLLREYDEAIYSDLKAEIGYYMNRKFLDMIEQFHNKDIYIPRFYLKEISDMRGKKIIIFGAGRVGLAYYMQLSKYEDIEIVAWADSNWHNCRFDFVDVIGADKIRECKFDMILIAVSKESMAREIEDILIKQGQLKEKIVWVRPECLLWCENI